MGVLIFQSIDMGGLAPNLHLTILFTGGKTGICLGGLEYGQLKGNSLGEVSFSISFKVLWVLKGCAGLAVF